MTPSSRSVITGAYFALAAFFCFALQDAAVKWLVAGVAVVQVLFVRSAVIAAALTIRFPALWRDLVISPYRGALLLRGLLLLGAWLCYYTASRQLQLAEMTTIYYASPILVTVFSILFLGERVPFSRWLVAGCGFAGVVVACLPHDTSHPQAIALAFAAAVLWAVSITLMRALATRVPSTLQMLAQNAILLAACALVLPWAWAPLSPSQLLLMIAVGIIGGTGQYFIFEAARRAPASVTAPMEYTSLIWAFALGLLIWGDVPPLTVFIGGAVIIASGALLIMTERRRI